MKKTLFISTALLLAACTAPKPTLVHTTQPILNIESRLADKLQTQLENHSAKVKNISAQTLHVTSYLYWYDQNGVTQPFSPKQEYTYSKFILQPQQSTEIQLTKPSAESHQYRLYLGSK